MVSPWVCSPLILCERGSEGFIGPRGSMGLMRRINFWKLTPCIQGHFFAHFTMLYIEAGESFPECPNGSPSLSRQRSRAGKKSCGVQVLLPSTVLPGRNRRRCARQVKKTGCESEKTTQIALTTRSGSPLSE